VVFSVGAGSGPLDHVVRMLAAPRYHYRMADDARIQLRHCIERLYYAVSDLLSKRRIRVDYLIANIEKFARLLFEWRTHMRDGGWVLTEPVIRALNEVDSLVLQVIDEASRDLSEIDPIPWIKVQRISAKLQQALMRAQFQLDASPPFQPPTSPYELLSPYVAGSSKIADSCRFVFVERSGPKYRINDQGEPPEPTISVDVYADTDDDVVAQRIIDAAQMLAEVMGYDGAVDERIHRGSIWRRAKAVLKRGANSREVRDRLTKVERALELHHIDLKQAEFDSREAQAISVLLESLRDVSQACVRVGAILLIKYQARDGAVVLSRSMSQVEIRALERFPEIQINPQSVLACLATAVAEVEAVEDGSRAATGTHSLE
jgi:hypothetical protein